VKADQDEEFVQYMNARLTALKRLAGHLCGDRVRADDLVQETATRIYTRWSKIRTVDRLDQYVNSVMINLHIDETRRGWFHVKLTAAPPDRVVADSDAASRTALRWALAALPARQRAVLVLRFLQDLPVREVAELLGCSEGTVKSQTHDGLAKLRALMNSDDQPIQSQEQINANR
jgi:RNA polymerase sigma-70 factor (sigma-E family)